MSKSSPPDYVRMFGKKYPVVGPVAWCPRSSPDLPKEPGNYFITAGGVTMYVGTTHNIHKRIIGHRHMLSMAHNLGFDVALHYMIINRGHTPVRFRKALESQLISDLNPPINRQDNPTP